MSKQLTIIMPDNYYINNVKKRIELEFPDPKLKILETESIPKKMADMLLAISELQAKLKELSNE